MRVFCVKEELIKGIQIICPIVSSRNALPVLSNFLFEAKSNNKIKLSYTDLETAIQCYIKGEIIEEGSIAISAKRFADIIKELPIEKKIEIKTCETNQINIESDRSKFNIMGIAKTEYPIIPEFPKENIFEIKKIFLTSMLKKTIFAVSKDSQRYALSGVCFIMENNNFKMVATDGRRLAYVATDKIQAMIKKKAIVSAKAVTDILRLLSLDIKAETVKIGITDNQIAVRIEEIIFLSTLIESIFPNYEQIIPKQIELKVKLSVKDTLSAVKQVATLTGDRFSPDRLATINFFFNHNILRISTSTAGFGSGVVELWIDYKDEPVQISLNPNFVREVLQNIDEEFLIFGFKNSISPITIIPDEDKRYICVIMPMRV
jgi:DNA polymerase-3 subunit beta